MKTINEILEKYQISIRELARRLEYNHSYIARVVNGDEPMSYRLAYRISKVMGISLDYIVELEELD